MSRHLECEIVRDLLPSYADGQTSDVTNAAVEEHLSGCADCREMLRRMREPETAAAVPEEIDYLKKVKRSGRRAVWIAAAGTLLTALLAAALLVFAYGHASDLNAQAAEVRVEGSTVRVSGSLVSSGEGVARIAFSEQDGTVDIRLFTAPAAPFNRGSFDRTYTVRSGPVKAVTSGGIVIWENGEPISREAGRLYAAKNPYVGNMPANRKAADAVGVSEQFGPYTNELQTAQEPYGWTIILERTVEVSQETRARQRMLSDSCLLIAAVGNLGSVTWRYETAAGLQEYTVSQEEASRAAGAQIKSFAESASGMQALLDAVR